MPLGMLGLRDIGAPGCRWRRLPRRRGSPVQRCSTWSNACRSGGTSSASRVPASGSSVCGPRGMLSERFINAGCSCLHLLRYRHSIVRLALRHPFWGAQKLSDKAHENFMAGLMSRPAGARFTVYTPTPLPPPLIPCLCFGFGVQCCSMGFTVGWIPLGPNCTVHPPGASQGRQGCGVAHLEGRGVRLGHGRTQALAVLCQQAQAKTICAGAPGVRLEQSGMVSAILFLNAVSCGTGIMVEWSGICLSYWYP